MCILKFIIPSNGIVVMIYDTETFLVGERFSFQINILPPDFSISEYARVSPARASLEATKAPRLQRGARKTVTDIASAGLGQVLEACRETTADGEATGLPKCANFR